MRDIVAGLSNWLAHDEPFAVATVVRTWNSAPRAPGATMAVSRSGGVLGSVSGGCVEGALYETALDVIADGGGRLERFVVADDDAFGVGLTCGGTIEVFVRRVDPASPVLGRLLEAITADRPVAMVTDLTPGGTAPPTVVTEDEVFDDSAWSGHLLASVRRRVGSSKSDCYTVEDISHTGARRELLVEIFNPRPKMIVFGAIDFATALSRLASFVGYHVTVVDARPVFATEARFPDADDVVVAWPHRFLDSMRVDHTTVLAVLTHDEKFDLPLLERALRSDAAYIGALGSRATHERRVAALVDHGVPVAALDRLHSPIGLDLGARTPEETAVSILAEIMKTVRHASGDELRGLTGPIHRAS